MFIIVAAANSVNFTDGLDGLAGGLLLFTYGVYGFITYDQ
jgi:UDP-N-acetylmuramyl pentapeptide phosphotransferase/UDP-N-acetylglucosamine-1-phosphate transferase